MAPYRIELAQSALDDLERFKKFERVVIFDAIESQLLHQPDVETRKRKRLRESVLARWELRQGKFRVFYNVLEDKKLVQITAVGFKEHNRLFVGGKEVEI